MHEAVRVRFSSNLRPKISMFLRRRKVDLILAINTKNVVVLRPPAVEPVEPPMSIKKIITNLPASVIRGRLAVFIPAVLALTDWKKQDSSLLPAVYPLYIGPLYSRAKSTKAPRKTRIVDILKTTLL